MTMICKQESRAVASKPREAQCFLPTPNDSSIAIYISLHKSRFEYETRISNNTMKLVIYPAPIPSEVSG